MAIAGGVDQARDPLADMLVRMQPLPSPPAERPIIPILFLLLTFGALSIASIVFINRKAKGDDDGDL